MDRNFLRLDLESQLQPTQYSVVANAKKEVIPVNDAEFLAVRIKFFGLDKLFGHSR